MGSSTEIAINPHLYKKLNYDTQRDFAPVSHVASTPLLIVVHPSLPAKRVKELIALAKRRPGELNYASAGAGSFTHLAMALFVIMTNTNIVHVPYKGGAPSVIATMSGESQITFASVGASIPPIKQGKLIALAVSGLKRNVALPDVPTVADTVPGFEVAGRNGLAARRGVPPQIVERLNAEINAAWPTYSQGAHWSGERPAVAP